MPRAVDLGAQVILGENLHGAGHFDSHLAGAMIADLPVWRNLIRQLLLADHEAERFVGIGAESRAFVVQHTVWIEEVVFEAANQRSGFESRVKSLQPAVELDYLPLCVLPLSF